MMTGNVKKLITGFLIIFFACGCGPRYKYDRLVKKELATGIRHDTIFLGIYLGMTQKDFYSHCWKLNKQGIIQDGNGNTSVLYKMTELNEPVDMNFYPSFYNGKIWKMPVKFNYAAWAQWNRKLFADSLQQKILARFKEWYGNDFIEVKSKSRGSAYYKIDGNRKISLYKLDDQYVMAVFTDLLIEPEIQKIKKEKTDSIPANQEGASH